MNDCNCAYCTYSKERRKSSPLPPGDGDQRKKKEKVRRHFRALPSECRRLFFPKRRQGRIKSPHVRRAGSAGRGSGGGGYPPKKTRKKISFFPERPGGDLPEDRGFPGLPGGPFSVPGPEIPGKIPPKSRISLSECTIRRSQNEHNLQIVWKNTNNS